MNDWKKRLRKLIKCEDLIMDSRVSLIDFIASEIAWAEKEAVKKVNETRHELELFLEE